MQGGAVEEDGDGNGRDGIADKVADGEVQIERRDRDHEGKAAGHHAFQAMPVSARGRTAWAIALDGVA